MFEDSLLSTKISKLLVKDFASRFASLMLMLFPCSAYSQGNRIVRDWWVGCPTDSTYAINVDSIVAYVKKYALKPRKKTTVAVIDGGFDLAHSYFNGMLWTNPAETLDGQDSDGNGFIDDINGWNFLGASDGQNIIRTGTEEYRAWKRLHLLSKTRALNAGEDSLKAIYGKKVNLEMYKMYALNQEYIWNHYRIVDSLMTKCYGDKATTMQDFKNINVEDTTGIMEPISTVVMRSMQYDNDTPWADVVSKVRVEAEVAMKRLNQLESDDDVHRKVGNDPYDFANFTYGNSNLSVDAEDSYHGTMVAGLVAQVAKHTYSDVEIIPLRAIPDGDEYDRDVAAALRYAINQGVKVINMSFGKTLSPNRDVVDALLNEAEAKDILVIKASGNKGKDCDATTFYPSSLDIIGRRRANMIVVGAADSKGEMMNISNCGKNTVDVLAPGYQVKSTAPGEEWSTNNGTSLAAPIVTGLAAMIRSYFPKLTAAEVRDIIMVSSDGIGSYPVAAGRINAAKAFREAAGRYGKYLTSEELYESMISFSSPEWVNNESRYFTYNKEYIEDGEKHIKYILGDTKLRTMRILFNDTELKSKLKPFLTEKQLKGRVRPHTFVISEENPIRVYFQNSGKTFVYDLQNAAIDTTTLADADKYRRRFDYDRETWKSYSADSLFYVYAYDHDLYLANTQSGDSIRMTTDGAQFNSYSISGSSMRESAKGRSKAVGRWLGKTHQYVVLREDKRDVPTMSLVNNMAKGRPTVVSYKFNVPGDTLIPRYTMSMLDADTKQINVLDIDAYPDQMIETPKFRGMVMSGDYAYVLRKSRAQNEIDLLRINPYKQTAETIIHQKCAPHLNEQLFNYHVLNDGKDILWWAENGDKGQWWLYSGEGKLRNAVTPASMVAGQIEHIDTLARTVILRGYGREVCSNPEYVYYYKVGLNGKGFTLLTPGDGEHEMTMTKDAKMFYDTYSRIDAAPVGAIRDMRGNLVFELGQTDLSILEFQGWKAPRLIKVKSADNTTDLYGNVYTPYYIKEVDKLPIVSNPYPGPHTDLMQLSFTSHEENQDVANDGFIVISYAYRGSNPKRGRNFYTYGYGNLRDYALDDDSVTIVQIAEKIPQADLSRVGIYGHSGGGFMAATALLTRPDFYKVAIAASGNYDNNIYLKWWGETFHGIKQQTDSLGHVTWDAHVPTTMELAPRLKGDLLLIHGDMDNNVHPASTIRLANALINAGKHFDMLMIPGADHGLGDKYYNSLIRSYLKDKLKGEKIPVDLIKR